MTPPLALISSKVKRRTSRREVSEMAMVPLREWRTPTLTASSAARAVKVERVIAPTRATMERELVSVRYVAVLRLGDRKEVGNFEATSGLADSSGL